MVGLTLSCALSSCHTYSNLALAPGEKLLLAGIRKASLQYHKPDLEGETSGTTREQHQTQGKGRKQKHLDHVCVHALDVFMERSVNVTIKDVVSEMAEQYCKGTGCYFLLVFTKRHMI